MSNCFPGCLNHFALSAVMYESSSCSEFFPELDIFIMLFFLILMILTGIELSSHAMICIYPITLNTFSCIYLISLYSFGEMYIQSISCLFVLLIVSVAMQKFGVDSSPFIYFCFCCLRFWCFVQNIVAKANVLDIFPMFSSRRFVFSGLTFTSLIHFELILCMV